MTTTHASARDVIGWGRAPSPASAKEATVARAIVDMLFRLGVRQAFGVLGGGGAHVYDALEQSEVEVHHFRHEGGAAFAATEAYFAGNRVTTVFTTTGPGITNALSGLHSARNEGARVLLISGATGAVQCGRGAVQETSAAALAHLGIFAPGTLFHEARVLSTPSELDVVERRLALGLTRPGGFLGHVALPTPLQLMPAACVQAAAAVRAFPPAPNVREVERWAKLLLEAPFVVWLGFGARGEADRVRELVRRTGAPVMCSPRAKGVFPERDARFIGVTGAGGHDSVKAYLARHRPARALVLGSRLGELTSFFDRAFVPGIEFLHVDVDPCDLGAAFPGAPLTAITSDIGSFLDALLTALPPTLTPEEPAEIRLRPMPALAPRGGPVRPEFIMQSVQRVFIDASDAMVMAEAGNSFLWANHALRFSEPGRYRTSGTFASMGQFTAGVVGAALASKRRCVAIVGDGAMMMNNEISTAVRYGCRPIWVVLNDAQYGISEHGMRALGYAPTETQFPRADFVRMAQSMGAAGARVEREADLEEVLSLALRADGPFIVDILVDPTTQAPVVKQRIDGLKGGARV